MGAHVGGDDANVQILHSDRRRIRRVDQLLEHHRELIGEDRINELSDTVFSYSITAQKK